MAPSATGLPLGVERWARQRGVYVEVTGTLPAGVDAVYEPAGGGRAAALVRPGLPAARLRAVVRQIAAALAVPGAA